VVDEPKHLTAYFPKQLGVAKDLLEDTKTKGNTFLPSKLEMYKEKLELLGRITKIQLAWPEKGVWQGVEEIGYFESDSAWFAASGGCLLGFRSVH
jgi:hypothetical protein